MENKHILIIPSWYLNDYKPMAGSFFRDQALGLKKEGFKVGVITVNNYSGKLILSHKKFLHGYTCYSDNGIETYRFDMLRFPIFERINSYLLFTHYKKIFKRYIKNNGLPDIVHLHSYLAGKAALWLKQKYNMPLVFTEHSSSLIRETLSEFKLFQIRHLYEKCDKILAVSKGISKYLSDKFNVNFQYLPNFISMKGFVPVQRKDKIYRYINIAWMKKNKNQSMLIHAFHKTFKDMENVELVLIGDGPERKNLELQIKELNLEDRVILKGNINREDIPHELQQADAFVLSSQIETFGVVLIEAMSCGLPVIATRCGGPESIISNDTLGILCRINIDSLSKALLHVYHSDYDPQLIRQHVMDNFSEKAVISKLSTIYQELMGEKQSDGA